MRTEIQLNQLQVLVEQEVAWFAENKIPFTAYSVTINLRRNNPLFEIVHDDVRQMVVNLIGDWITDEDQAIMWKYWWFEVTEQDWNGNIAITYKSVPKPEPKPQYDSTSEWIKALNKLKRNEIFTGNEPAKPEPLKKWTADEKAMFGIKINWK